MQYYFALPPIVQCVIIGLDKAFFDIFVDTEIGDIGTNIFFPDLGSPRLVWTPIDVTRCSVDVIG